MKYLDKAVPWSYSKLSTYEKCPKSFYYSYCGTVRRATTNPYMIRGNKVHSEFERWVTLGAPAKGPALAMPFRDHVLPFVWEEGTPFRPDTLVIEANWGHRSDWTPTMNWSTPDTWARVKLDFANVERRHIIDWKTGKKYPTHKDQGEIYGVAFLARHPKAESVEVEFAYVDLKDVAGMTVKRTDIPRITEKLAERVLVMASDEEFEHRPSHLCGWCDFSKTKGGPCSAG